MKKQIIKFNIFLFLFVFTFFLVLPNYNVVKASESSFEDDIKSFVNKDTFVDKSTNDYTISDFQQKYKQIKVLQYLPFKSINSNDRKQKEIVKYSYYKDAVLHIDVLSSDSFDKNEVLKEIDSFYNDRTDYEKSSSNNFKMSANSELFVPITSGYKRIISKPYGYMDHSYEVKKYRSSDISSLYIVETNSDFIPGSIAYKNGNTSFDEKMRCNFGFIHLDVPQAIVEIDQSMIRKGGVPVFKDAWPINNPGMVTISSTYNVNTTIGNSYKNGFSLDNISIENQSEYGVNIGYTYSKSYTNQEPRLSTQHDADRKSVV